MAIRALGRHISRVIWSMLRHGRDYIEPAREQLKKSRLVTKKYACILIYMK